MRVYVDQARIDSYTSLPDLMKQLVRPLMDFDGEICSPVPLGELEVFGDSILEYISYPPVNVIGQIEAFRAQSDTTARLQSTVESAPANLRPEAPTIDWATHLTCAATPDHAYAIGLQAPQQANSLLNWTSLASLRHPTSFIAIVDPYMFAKARWEESAARVADLLSSFVEPIPNRRLQIVLMYRWDTVGKTGHSSPGQIDYDRPANSMLRKALKNKIRHIGFDKSNLAFVNILYRPQERSHDRFAITQQYLVDGGATVLNFDNSDHLSRVRLSYHNGRQRKCPDVVRRFEELERVFTLYTTAISAGDLGKDYAEPVSVTDLGKWLKDWRGLLGLE